MKSAANAEFLVVVAEDDPSVRNAVERVLELEGYQVKTANDGNAALDLIVSSKPHAVVMDVMMPFADGLTVTRELRHRGNRTPVLLLTARHEVGDRVAGLDAGADDISRDGSSWKILSEPNAVYDVKTALETAGIEVLSAESTMVSSTIIDVTDAETAAKIMKVMDALEDNDDVQDVYANFDISDEIMESLG